MNKYLLTLALCLGSTALHAQDVRNSGQESFNDNVRPYNFLFGMGITGGGDKLATVNFTNGSSESIDAGGVVYVKAGVDWRIAPKVSLQAAIGYHTDLVNAQNGDVKFNRSFAEGIAFVDTFPGQRIGVGARQTSGAKFSSGGAASSAGNVDFKSNVGALVEYEFLLSSGGNRGASIVVRYVAEKYTPSKVNGVNVTGKDVDGSHFGLGFNLYF